MASPHDAADKASALRQHHALNPRPQTVRDPAFAGDNPFFDARDLVQVKYEMLRRVRDDGQHVSETSAVFGFSRPSFYEALAAFQQRGLTGLLPQRPGPKRAHKLSEDVLDKLQAALADEPGLTSADLAGLVRREVDLIVHPRSIERALQRRRRKKGPSTRSG